MGAFPWIGQLLNEIFFENRSRVKQDRLNQFTELLENYLSNHRGINLENFQTVEFGDLFESVLKKVVQTNSKGKLKLLSNVITNSLENPKLNIEESEIYLDLISSLTEMEIKVLHEHYKFDQQFPLTQNQMLNLSNIISMKNNALQNIITNNEIAGDDPSRELSNLNEKYLIEKNGMDMLQMIRKAVFYNITEGEFLFFKQRLYSKGLLVDNGVGAIGGGTFITMGITEFGKKFIEYIEKNV